jgi:WS/DGAT/MGAT family acyltransferase
MRLSATDAAFLYSETASGPMHISSVFVVEGELTYERFFQHFAERMHLLPAYKRKIAMVPFNMSHPKWVDDPDFDLSKHLYHHELTADVSFQEALDFTVNLNEPMLDRSKPLWENHIVTGLPGLTFVLNRTHHCMIDGASGMELAQVMYDFEPDPTPPEVPPQKEVEQPPGQLQLYNEAVKDNLLALSEIRPTDWMPENGKQRELIQRASKVFTDFVTRPAITAPFNRSMVGPKRRADFLRRSFSEIREVRRAFGGTINDVVLTVVSEGMARYLSNHEQKLENKHMRVMCPVNVRTEDLKGALGNQVSAIFPMLPAWPMDPSSRFAAVRTEMENIKSNEDAQAVTLASEAGSGIWPLAMAPTQVVGTSLDPTVWAARFPLPVMPDLGWQPPNVGINFVCTNVPGVQVPLYLAGHKVRDTIGLLILCGNVGFSTTVLSYNKELYINYICEPRLMPDLDALTTASNEAFDELLAAARQHVEELTGT